VLIDSFPFERVPALVAYIDATGVYRCMSASYEEWCGIDRAEILGRHYGIVLSLLFGHEYVHNVRDRLCQALGGEAMQFEATYARGSGVRHALISYTPEFDGSGAVLGILVFVNDITDFKRVELSARESEERLRLAAEASGMGVWDHDFGTDCLTWNEACSQVIGLESTGRALKWEQFQEHIHPEDRDHRTACWTFARDRQEAYESEFRVLAEDGSYRWILTRGRFLLDESGTPMRGLGVVLDISGRKKAEEEANRQRRRIEEILESTTDGVALWDREWRCNYLNGRGRELIDGRNLLGRILWEEFPDTLGTAFEYHYRRTMSERVPTTFEAYYAAPLKMWLELHAYPTEEGIAIFFRDITERRVNEERLRLNAQAIDSVRAGITIAKYSKKEDYPLVFVNRAFEKLTGYAAEELMGRNCRILQGQDTDQPARAEIRTALEEGRSACVVVRNYKKNGKQFFNELQISMVRNREGEITHVVGIQNDITERVQSRERLARIAQYDGLTGLPNRYLFMDRLKQALRESSRTGQELTVVCLDVDNFKHVNDSLGHFYGDRLLKHVGRRISSVVRATDTVARLGGDEFALFCRSNDGLPELGRLMERLIQSISSPLRLCGQEVMATVSAGAAISPEDSSDAEELLRLADFAMYAAKRDQKNSWKQYRPELKAGKAELLNLTAGLRRALAKNEFVLHYQPRVETATGRIAGMEALVRWQHPERGLLSPGEFIRIAEETGLIIRIGQWVIEEAVRQNTAWREAGLKVLPISVNVSPAQFRNSSFVSSIATTLQKVDFPPQLLELELTESLLMDNEESADTALKELKDLGVRLAIDDFGTGYSGLSYLARFTVDTIKIDQSFTARIGEDETAAAICRSTLHLARELRLTTVAEGVESEEQVRLLQLWGCDELQGFYFAKPLPAAEVEQWLRKT
jgi:diguanylate cyclase (GGDEF)-like protein/PAS domain S-box-containing protein